MKKITGPTYLTIIRVILAVAFFVFVLLPEMWAQILALVLFVVAAITDLVDGKWARKKKQVTDLGAFLDPLADKMLVNLAFLALTYLGVVPVWVFAVILVRDFMVDGVRMMMARNGQTVAAAWSGKVKTAFQMTTLISLIFNLIVNFGFLDIINNILLYIVVILTVYSGAEIIKRNWK